ncbi:MAG TPA: mechanosensitive ion channel family protein [Candidatus Limenecus avicola]|uniref:Mechanosensitive ion channel family protein n=1 Tax=Candidatus Limenecus avicola TaxID=2840847 RepID=A0A9D1SQQ0_9CLOT|nr:mechanosensitive ion channel family protein [Candidatus Limenecus avicola]
MLEFIEQHRNFIFTILPDFLRNKWTMMVLNIIIFVFFIKIANIFIEKFLDRICRFKDDFEFKKQLVTLKSIVKSIVDTIIAAFGVMYILNGLGVDIRPILTAAGVLGVAVGFGAKRFFEDIITGMSILLEGQVRVGDYIEISGHQGVVEKVDIKLIQLRDTQGRVHYIRNGMVDTVVNYTRDYSYYVFDIGVAYKENVDNVINVLKEIDEDFRKNSKVKDYVLAPLEIFGLDSFDDSAVIIKARIRTSPIKQWEVGREFNKYIKAKFDEKGIEIPFPQRTVYLVNDNQDNQN